jgi:hypothetical protein
VARPAEGAAARQLAGDLAGHALDPRDLDRIPPAERREDRRQPLRKHRLARVRRAPEEIVVTGGGGDDERFHRMVLARPWVHSDVFALIARNG